MKNDRKEDDDQDIHHSKKRLQRAIKKISTLRNGPNSIEFLYHLQASGLSPVRVLKYANHLPRILESIDILKAERKDIEKFVADINGSSYKLWTKHGYKLAIKKLFQYLKNGSTVKDTPYPPEVSWIKVHISEAELEKESRISADKLLTNEEISSILKATRNARDEAMLTVLFEGAFRPGELLSMKVGSVQFLKDYCVISTVGKRGQKRIPLVVSFKTLMKWLSIHPFKTDARAPLWCALDTGHLGHSLTYQHFYKILRKAKESAKVTKDVWPYLYRHTQLTSMADKLTDSKLKLFGGWTLDSKMVRRYVHWSGRDLDESVLAIHGLVKQESPNHIIEVIACPRCNEKNSPSSPRCEKCGFILDSKLAHEVEDDLLNRINKIEELVRGTLAGAGSPPSA